MNADRWQRIDDVLSGALTRPVTERTAFVAAACLGDEPLRLEIESLLSAHDRSGLLDVPVAQIASDVLSPGARTSAAGEQVGPYRVIQPLGSGAMGDVYLADDPRLGRKLALKILHGTSSQGFPPVARFAQEARAASALNHPNIATVYDVGRADGRYYIATELVDGQTLRSRLSAALPAVEAVNIAMQMASALQAAHRSGIVHRDIKPENVMLRRDGVVKIVDFGLAKFVASEARDPERHETLPGVVLGTTPYMSPEQAQGFRVDTRTDLFSLGVVLFEMLTGHPPFGGPSIGSAIASILWDEPSLVSKQRPGVPAELDRIIATALRKDPDRRYQDADHLLADLQQVAAGRFATRGRLRGAALVLFAGIVSALVAIAQPAGVPALEDPNAAAAQQVYVKGRFFLNQRTVPALASSIRYFEEATVLAPRYAPGYAGMAAAYLALLGNPASPKPAREYIPEIRRAALGASRLDPKNVEARVLLATIKQIGESDWAGAEREFKHALALDPSYATAHHRYGVHLAFKRRFDEAIAALKRAEQLDPVSLAIVTDLGMVYNFARQPDDAIPQLEKALEIDRTFARARFNLAEAYRQKGLFDQALSVIEDMPIGEREFPGRIVRAYFHQLAGRPIDMQALLADVLSERAYVPAYFVALLYAMLGDNDRVFHYLEKARVEGGGVIGRLYVDSFWETFSVSSDPRFAALLRSVGLPPPS